MKANHLQDVLVMSLILISIAIGTLMILKQFDPIAYNQITGQITGTTVNVTPGTRTPCNFTLYQDFNLVSFFCIGDYNTVNDIFANVSNLQGIWSYDTSSSDPWKAHHPNLPSWVVLDLDTISKRKGYWVLMGQTESYFYNGTRARGLSIVLEPGYQLVGYPDNITEAIPGTFVSIDGNYTKVVSWNPVTQTELSYVVGSGGTLTQVEPYRGYWINATENEEWDIN